MIRSALCVTLAIAMLAAPGRARAAEPAKNTKPAARPRPIDLHNARLKPSRIVPYKRAGQRELSLHLFNPDTHKPTDKRPALIVIHGGGWTGGSPSQMYYYAHHLAQRGWVGVSVEYRLARAPFDQDTVYNCVKDARSAVRYVRDHAAELGVDPQRLVVAGGSAGAHLAAATALFDTLNDADDDTAIPTTPAALVLFYPVIDTSPQGYGQKKIGPTWRALSPVDHVRPGLPPTLILHGSGDTVTPYAGAQRFTLNMTVAGNRCTLITHPGGRHGYFTFDEKLLVEAVASMDGWLESLGYPTAPAR